MENQPPANGQLPSNRELVEWCLRHDVDISGIMELSKIVYRMIKAHEDKYLKPVKTPSKSTA